MAPQPVRPIVGQPVAPVRPISDTRTQAAPPVTIHNQPRAAHPFIESVRPRVDASRAQVQPPRQIRSMVESMRPRFNGQQQRRQASQPQQRRG